MNRRPAVIEGTDTPPEPTVAAEGGTVDPLAFRSAVSALARCAARVAVQIVSGGIAQPVDRKGLLLSFADGSTSSVYRETVVRGADPREPVVLVVGFRLRRIHGRFSHALFRAESELNTVLFAGFPGLVSKLWFRDDQRGLYRGIYQWDGEVAAARYVRALWWALAAVSERDSIRYMVIPGVRLDPFLEGKPGRADADTVGSDWWRPTRVLRPYRPDPSPSQNP